MAVNPGAYPYQVFRVDHDDDPGLCPGGGFRGCAATEAEGRAKLSEIVSASEEPGVYELRQVLEDRLIRRITWAGPENILR